MLSSAIDTSIAAEYRLRAGSTPVNVAGVSAVVNQLSSQNIVVDGVKGFRSAPYITLNASEFPSNSEQYGHNLDFVVPNVSKVKSMLND